MVLCWGRKCFRARGTDTYDSVECLVAKCNDVFRWCVSRSGRTAGVRPLASLTSQSTLAVRRYTRYSFCTRALNCENSLFFVDSRNVVFPIVQSQSESGFRLWGRCTPKARQASLSLPAYVLCRVMQ